MRLHDSVGASALHGTGVIQRSHVRRGSFGLGKYTPALLLNVRRLVTGIDR